MLKFCPISKSSLSTATNVKTSASLILNTENPSLTEISKVFHKELFFVFSAPILFACAKPFPDYSYYTYLVLWQSKRQYRCIGCLFLIQTARYESIPVERVDPSSVFTQFKEWYIRGVWRKKLIAAHSLHSSLCICMSEVLFDCDTVSMSWAVRDTGLGH